MSIILLFLVFTTSQNVYANCFFYIQPSTHFENAENIFSGKLVEKEEAGFILHFEVHQTRKGKQINEISVSTIDKSYWDSFQIGKLYIVYTDKNDSTKHCIGNKEYSSNLSEELIGKEILS